MRKRYNNHMSGHSKWAQIKRQKGVTDIKRGQAFTKLANAITIAVRQGGGVSDPSSNFKLRLIIDKAREVNMPKENIKRAIDRGLGIGGKGALDEVLYEGFGPSGIALIIEATTDNRQRTTSEIKNILEKAGGTLGSPGSTVYLFKQMGVLTVEKQDKSLDEIFLLSADLGAEDIEEAGEMVLIYTQPVNLMSIKQKLESEHGFKVMSAELTYKPVTTVSIMDGGKAKSILNIIEKLEGITDVQNVYANFDIPEEFLS